MRGSKPVSKCAHHWVLSSPVAGTVTGVCKKCQAIRQYPASVDDMTGEPATQIDQDGRPAGRGRPVSVEGPVGNVI
jgi:hypothetical protein